MLHRCRLAPPGTCCPELWAALGNYSKAPHLRTSSASGDGRSAVLPRWQSATLHKHEKHESERHAERQETVERNHGLTLQAHTHAQGRRQKKKEEREAGDAIPRCSAHPALSDVPFIVVGVGVRALSTVSSGFCKASWGSVVRMVLRGGAVKRQGTRAKGGKAEGRSEETKGRKQAAPTTPPHPTPHTHAQKEGKGEDETQTGRVEEKQQESELSAECHDWSPRARPITEHKKGKEKEHARRGQTWRERSEEEKCGREGSLMHPETTISCNAKVAARHTYAQKRNTRAEAEES